jgi:hypothetical protein
MLEIIVLNRILYKAHNEISKSRRQQDWSKHLQKRIMSTSQFKNVKCFSRNKYEIECFCVDQNSFARLLSTIDVNLLIVFVFIITNWVKHATRYFKDDSLLNNWNLRQSYTHEKLNHLAFSLRIQDRSLLECRNEIFHNTTCYINASTIIIIIAKNCYNQHVVNSFIKIINVFKRTFKFKQNITREYMKFAWNRACVNKTHQNQKINNIVIVIFKNLNHHVRKWFFTRTSF